MTAVTGNVPSTSSPAQLTPAPGRYEIDTSCSAITFTTRHLFGAAPVRGSFAIRFGIIEVADPLPGSSVYAQVSPASFRTGQQRRDRKVRSARLLDADRYPVIAFTSEQVDSAVVSGELTVRNVTMPASLRIESCTLAAHSFNLRAAIRIDRTEFGVVAYRGLAGRYLDLTVEARCVRA
jgi:polyisoprenoid-binding protein YceI